MDSNNTVLFYKTKVALERAIPDEFVKEKTRSLVASGFPGADICKEIFIALYNDSLQTPEQVIEWYERAILLAGHPETAGS